MVMSRDVGILNFWPFKNMGGVLQAWALQKVINNLGYNSILLNFQKYLYQQQYKDSFVEKFAKNCLTYLETV